MRRFIRKRRQQPEAAIQRAVFEHIAYRANKGWRFWMTPNAAKRSLQMGAELRAQGMTAGVGDISMVSPTGRYHELELKVPRGRLSAAQRKRQDELRASGVICAVAYGLDAALAILAGWGAIR